MTEICKGRVAIITGAGGGLGAAYAKAFAAEGAKVVVNDINEAGAQATVDEILAAGGEALVNNSDITDYTDSANAVKMAIEHFGELHIVVNNAGIVRDRMFASMTESEWDAVIAVHLKGHFCITSHAVHYWRDQFKAGHKIPARIVNTSSGAGLNGSIGQSNYAAAKAGIAALTLNQAAELRRYGITANALAPSARTAMTEPVFGEQMKSKAGEFDKFHPANIAPLVVWLGSEQSGDISGQIFEAEGGKISLCDGWRSTKGIDKNARWEPDEIGEAVGQLVTEAEPAQKVYGA